MILHATSVFLVPDFFWQVDLWVIFFPSGSWWRSRGWIFLLSTTSTNLDFLELFRCCVFRQWKDLHHFIWFRSFFEDGFMWFFHFPQTPSPTRPNFIMCKFNPPKKEKKKKKKRRNLKKNNSIKSKRVWHVLELVEATLLPPTQDSWYEYNIFIYIKKRFLYLKIK